MVKIDRGTLFQICIIAPLFIICSFLIIYFVFAFILSALADLYSKGSYTCNITAAGFDLNLIKFFIYPSVINKYNIYSNLFNITQCNTNKTLNYYCDNSFTSYISYYDQNISLYLKNFNITSNNTQCNNYIYDIFCNSLTFDCSPYSFIEYNGILNINCTILNYPNFNYLSNCIKFINSPCKYLFNDTILYTYLDKFEYICNLFYI